jgi:Domain of unknown function (DUF4919)
MKKSTLVIILLFTLNEILHSQQSFEVIIPPYDDSFSKNVAKLEKGELNIDFRDFRESFIESQQFIDVAKQRELFDSLEKVMYRLMRKHKFEELVVVTKKMLSINYTSMQAHKTLRQAYKAMGDLINSQKYYDIQFGMLNSILQSGDGETCATAWSVISIEEEYFILDKVLDAKLRIQSIDKNGGLCDKMETKTRNGKQTYYFETTKILEGYSKFVKK